MELFLDRLPELERHFKKESGYTSRLSENAENWPQELQSDLYKQLPFLSDYSVNVNLDRVEPNRGFAFGYADVSNKTERPEQEHTAAGLPHIRIPVIVQERGVKPFSVYVDGENVKPLTEDRIRETLFNPATFDLSTSEPVDPSLLEALSPPGRSGGSSGGGETKQASISKEAFNHISKPQWDAIYKSDKIQKLMAKNGGPQHPEVTNAVYEMAAKTYGFHPKVYAKPPEMQQAAQAAKPPAQAKPAVAGAKPAPQQKTASLLEAIAPTIRETDRNAFIKKVAADPTLGAGFARSGIDERLDYIFNHVKRASAADTLGAIVDSVLPTVVTIQKLPGGDFFVKSAAVDSFVDGPDAQGRLVSAEEAGDAMGPETAQQMQPGQTATAVADPVEEVEPEPPTNAKVVEEFGEYLCQDTMGNNVMGWVFPTTLSWDGEFSPEPIALFTNGSAYALQDSVAGELVGKGVTMPKDSPRGDGVFYSTEGGSAVCTAPLTIGSSSVGPDGNQSFIGQDMLGNQIQVTLAEGLSAPTRVSDVEYAIPMTWKFMRLNNQTQLVPDPMQMNKAASVRALTNSVTLFYNGAYNLDGGCGLSKLAHRYRYDLDVPGAEFALGLLGVDGRTAKHKIAEARKKGSVKLAGLKTVTTLGELHRETVKTASALVAKLPNLRKDLIKEAAVLNDTSTVDSLLALNFINPDNVSTFISYIPELEQTTEKLAEMLLYSYLGMKELPEGALERGMKNLEQTISGLKAVEHTAEN